MTCVPALDWPARHIEGESPMSLIQSMQPDPFAYVLAALVCVPAVGAALALIWR